MWKKSKGLLLRTVICFFLLFACCVFCQLGYTHTNTETTQSITIPITQWRTLTSEFYSLKQELLICKSESEKLKRPSSELVTQLQQAELMLKQLQQELETSKTELTLLSSNAAELKTSLTKLKGQINKERRIHRRQLWQNRFWFLIAGAAIGYAAGK